VLVIPLLLHPEWHHHFLSAVDFYFFIPDEFIPTACPASLHAALTTIGAHLPYCNLTYGIENTSGHWYLLESHCQLCTR
jgi:hypothetical protein